MLNLPGSHHYGININVNDKNHKFNSNTNKCDICNINLQLINGNLCTYVSYYYVEEFKLNECKEIVLRTLLK